MGDGGALEQGLPCCSSAGSRPWWEALAWAAGARRTSVCLVARGSGFRGLPGPHPPIRRAGQGGDLWPPPPSPTWRLGTRFLSLLADTGVLVTSQPLSQLFLKRGWGVLGWGETGAR